MTTQVETGTKNHPAVDILQNFLRDIAEHVDLGGGTCLTSDLACYLFVFLISNARNSRIQQEFIKSVMEIQFPDLSGENLLAIWELAISTYAKSDTDSPEKTAIQHVLKAAERRIEEDRRRQDEKDGFYGLLNRSVTTLNLTHDVGIALVQAGFSVIGTLVLSTSDQLTEILGTPERTAMVRRALLHVGLDFGSDVKGWKKPPEVAVEFPE
jgi:hypothetical protein